MISDADNNVRPTLRTVSELFAEYRLRKPLKGEHGRNTGFYLDSFQEAKGNCRLADLVAADLEIWIEDHPEWKSSWTKAAAGASVKKVFNWGWLRELIPRHPFRAIHFSAGVRREPMSDRMFRAILRDTSAEFRRVLLFLSWTGCRPIEMATLRWKDIDTIRGVAVLHKHKTAESRRDRAPRIICLPEKALRLLTWLAFDQRTDEDFVFLNKNGRPWDRRSLCLRIHRIRKRNGITEETTLYGIRHSFATRMMLNGVDLKTLSTLLGHTTSRMAEFYVHLAGDVTHLKTALERGLAGGKA